MHVFNKVQADNDHRLRMKIEQEVGISIPHWELQIQDNFESQSVPCECDHLNERTMPVSDAVIHLNDTHKWSFSKIADWLDSLSAPVLIPPKRDRLV